MIVYPLFKKVKWICDKYGHSYTFCKLKAFFAHLLEESHMRLVFANSRDMTGNSFFYVEYNYVFTTRRAKLVRIVMRIERCVAVAHKPPKTSDIV